MGILAKVLIVLLSFSSLFLCGMVVTYVGTAENYKNKYIEEKNTANVFKDEAATARKLADQKSQLVAEKIREYELKIQDLTDKSAQLELDLKDAQRQALAHMNRADNWQGILEGYSVELGSLRQMLDNTRSQLDQSRALGIKNQKELSERTASLYEKIVQLQAIEADKKRFLEEKTALEEKLEKVSTGDTVAIAPVTPEKTNIISSEAISSDADINGLVSEIHNNMASISLGTADGVKKGMVFHVTRGDMFICDISITDVDVNTSAGAMELKLQQPRVGDNVSTKL